MSWEAENWARRQRTGDPVTKAVLVGIANWVNPRGDEAEVSIRRIADEVEVSTRTVQRHIQRLEELGLLEKLERSRDDGGQGWNAFRFPTYKPIPVSHVEPAGKRAKPRDNLSPPPRQSDGGEGDSLTPSPMTQLCHGEGDIGVTPERGKGEDNSPPTPPAGGSDDGGGRNRGTRIPPDWTAPPISDLPPEAKAKARQWPAGAYEAEAEAFRNFWLGESRAGAKKIDWKRAWCNRINEITGRVLRDAKAGVKHAAPATGTAQPPKMLDSSREGTAARKIRDHICRRLGEQLYAQWIAPARLDVEGGTLTIVAVSLFASNYQRDNFGNEIGAAMHAVLGPDADLRFSNERPPA